MNDGFREKRLDKIRALREAVTFFRDNNDWELETVCEEKISYQFADRLVPDREVSADRKELGALLRAGMEADLQYI